MNDPVFFSRIVEPERWEPLVHVYVRKAWIGWWVDGSWCPTVRVRDHWMKRQFERKSST